MKKALVLLLGVCLVALLIGSAVARNAVDTPKKLMKDWAGSNVSVPDAADPGLRGLYESAATDTYYIVWYSFEQPGGWMGWARWDNSEQRAAYTHVDDFSGLSGGHKGHLIPLEGDQSMWCGARANPSDPYLCTWVAIPGYGNTWNQLLKSPAFPFVGQVSWSCKLHWDSEDGYDFTRLEYDAGNFNWVTIGQFTGNGDSVVAVTIALSSANTKLRYRFNADGAVSSEDGLGVFDGGYITDSVTVADNMGIIHYADFEAPAVGDTTDGWWNGERGAPFGKFSGLMSGLIDKDPCADDFGTQVVFFVGSPYPSASYPGLYDTPFCTGPGQKTLPCQDEIIISPVIDMSKYCGTNPTNALKDGTQPSTIPGGDLPKLGGTLYMFTVYRDLPSENCVYYVWHVRTIDPDTGCPSVWQDLNYVYYGPDKDYIFGGFDVSKWLATNGNVQIALGCLDYCYAWGTTSCKCVSHTASPWLDQVRLIRYTTYGPQWTVRGLELFQDNFPSGAYTLESYVRADMADDINLATNPLILPGDSAVVSVASPLAHGLALNVHGGPAVYMHARATYIGIDGAKPAHINGATLQGTYGTWVSTAGNWNVFECDSARYQGFPTPDAYCVDLNDSLFTRGYKIEYYFTAVDLNSVESALPWWCRSQGPYFEFTCLPTMNSDVLFVDHFDGRGSFRGSVEDYWNSVFMAVMPSPRPVGFLGDSVEAYVDRYDLNSPSSGVDNGVGSRASNAQLTGNGMGAWLGYFKIIWDCGDLESFCISNGKDDKSDDCDMLINWMDLASHRVGLWVCGDDVALDLHTLATANALGLMQSWCGMDYTADSYFDVTGGRTGGGIITPLVTGDPDLNLFRHGAVYDKWYVFGGCPIINGFDVIKKTGTGQIAATYPLYPAVGGTVQPAAVGNQRVNSGSFDVRTMWFGFSYQYVRDDVRSSPQDRFDIAKHVFDWMQNITNSGVSQGGVPAAYKLAQNFPNPFNPSTSIKFDMKDKGVVTLKIYNVAGQLVRTLADGVKDAGSYTITWDGKNNLGGSVASGIYFYKMETKDFSQTKKMVMLR